jgi:hypothetical protein
MIIKLLNICLQIIGLLNNLNIYVYRSNKSNYTLRSFLKTKLAIKFEKYLTKLTGQKSKIIYKLGK